MDILNVYVIYDPMKFTKTNIVDEIKLEGYKHNFYFGCSQSNSDAIKYLAQSNEVWVFGDCRDIVDYRIALELGMDVWHMG